MKITIEFDEMSEFHSFVDFIEWRRTRDKSKFLITDAKLNATAQASLIGAGFRYMEDALDQDDEYLMKHGLSKRHIQSLREWTKPVAASEPSEVATR